MNELLVSASHLKYKYKDCEKFAISDQSFEINRREVVGLIGPNGAGKTTLCLALKGIIPHKLGGKWGGNLNVCNLSVPDTTISELSKHVAMTFQNPETQIVGTTVEEDLAFLPENLGMDASIIRDEIDHYMNIVRLPISYKKRAPFNMSGGEKQRLSIAASLIAKPDLIILDEPTTELDPVGKLEVINVVNNVVKEGDSTFVIVEQDLDNLIGIANRLLVIINGEIELQGSTRDVLSHCEYLEENQINVSDSVKLWSKTNFKSLYPVFINIDEAARAINEQLSNGKLMFKDLHREELYENNNKNIVEFNNLEFSYNNNPVLKGINLEIKQGDFCAILGKNGAGKTTLVKHMNGLLKPTSGQVKIVGEDSKGKTVAEISRIVSYVFQNPDHQLFDQTVEKEIAFGPRNLGWDEEKIKSQVEYALDVCSLQSYRNENPLSLERGLKQLLILASVISMDVDVFVIDEPTTGLSRKYKRIIGDVLRNLNNNGKTIVLVTHDMNFVAEYVNKIIVIQDGKVSLNGQTREVFGHIKELEDAFVYPPQITLISDKVNHKFNSTPISVNDFINQMEWRD